MFVVHFCFTCFITVLLCVCTKNIKSELQWSALSFKSHQKCLMLTEDHLKCVCVCVSVCLCLCVCACMWHADCSGCISLSDADVKY